MRGSVRFLVASMTAGVCVGLLVLLTFYMVGKTPEGLTVMMAMLGTWVSIILLQWMGVR